MSLLSPLRTRLIEWWDGLHQGQQRRALLTGGLLAAALLGGLGYLALRPTLNRWRHHQALDQAAAFSAQQNHREMLLALQRATQIAPDDIDTWRRVATALSDLGLSEALLARQNIVALAPDDSAARLQLATDALRFDRPETGQAALAPLQDQPAHQAEVHRLSAEIARHLGDWPGLELHLRALLALSPDDADARLNLAIVELRSPDFTRRQAALAQLETLATVPKVRLRAAIQLLEEAANSRNADRVGAVVALLLARLPAGTVAPTAPAWSRLIDALQTSAGAGTDADLALLARWFGRVRLNTEALAWIDTLPEPRRTTPALREVAAGLAARAGDLARLRQLLESGAWGPLPGDAVTLALAGHLQHLSRAEARSRETWGDAIAAAQSSPAALTALARLAQTWREVPPAEAALRALIGVQPRAFWAYAALQASYTEHGDSLRLLNLYELWQQNLPDDVALASAWVRLGCVLDRVSPKMDEALARFSPAPSAIRVAQAALLWRRHAVREASETLRSVEANTRETAFWITVVEAAAGHDRTAAAAALQITQPEQLFSEELALLDGAASKAGFSAPSAWKAAALKRAQASTSETR